MMVGGITDDFTRFLCKGLREAAKEQDVNMVVLPGKFLDRDYAQNTDIMYEYQYDTLFSSVKKGRLDVPRRSTSGQPVVRHAIFSSSVSAFTR